MSYAQHVGSLGRINVDCLDAILIVLTGLAEHFFVFLNLTKGLVILHIELARNHAPFKFVSRTFCSKVISHAFSKLFFIIGLYTH